MCYAWVAYAAQAVAAAVTAYSAVQQGQATYKAEKMNEQIALRNVQAAENEQKNVSDAAAIERRRLGERIRAERGMGKVNAAANGIDPLFGTPYDIDTNILTAGRADAAIIGRNELTDIGRLDYQIADLHDSAAQSRAKARGALRAGYMEAGANIFQAAGSIANSWIQNNPGGGKPSSGQRSPPPPSSIFDPPPERRRAPIGW